MAKYVAKDTQFKIGTHGTPGTPTDRSTYFDSIDFPRSADEIEVSTFGNNGNSTYLPGLKGHTFEASGLYDATIGEHLDSIFDNQDIDIAYEYGPISDATGMPKYTGTLFCKDFKIGSKVNDKIPFTATFRLNSVTLGSYS